MSATNERNEQVREILDYLYNKAVDDSVKIDESAYKGSLEKLFSTTAWALERFFWWSLSGCDSTTTSKHLPVYTTAIRGQFMKDPLRNFLLKRKSLIGNLAR